MHNTVKDPNPWTNYLCFPLLTIMIQVSSLILLKAAYRESRLKSLCMYAKYTAIQLENLSHESSRFTAACEQLDLHVLLKKNVYYSAILLLCTIGFSSFQLVWSLFLSHWKLLLLHERSVKLLHSYKFCYWLWPVDSFSIIYIVSIHTIYQECIYKMARLLQKNSIAEVALAFQKWSGHCK